ncbi:MAG: hypothetical protein H7Y00_01120 [Fimbriimonadaceae bacterium]|nr:hypothetical protein [Chitinophagales bacterium]
MKMIFILLPVFFFIEIISAQQLTHKEYAKHLKKINQSKEEASVVISLDTIYNKGEAYALFIKVTSAGKDYSVKNLSGNELIYWRFNSYDNPEYTGNIGSVQKNYYYEIIFPANQKRCETEFKTVQQMGDFILENDLIHENGLNEDAVDGLIQAYGNKYSTKRNKPVQVFYGEDSGKEYKLAERDRTKLITLNNNLIEQDNIIIGSIESKTKNEGVVTYFNYTIKLQDGTTIATAKHQNYGAEDIEIKTMKDSKIIRLAKPDYWIDKTIVQYLIDNFYL